jgi:hypothetical protein
MALFGFLSPTIEVKSPTVSQPRKIGVQRSRSIVAKLAGLFALDAFAGGFIVQSIVASWFYLRYQTDLNVLGGIFFGTNVLAALSFLAPGDRPSFRTVSLTRYGDLHRAMTGWTY